MIGNSLMNIDPYLFTKFVISKGGIGSGYFGHTGVLGEVGGSAPSSAASISVKGHEPLTQRNVKQIAYIAAKAASTPGSGPFQLFGDKKIKVDSIVITGSEATVAYDIGGNPDRDDIETYNEEERIGRTLRRELRSAFPGRFVYPTVGEIGMLVYKISDSAPKVARLVDILKGGEGSGNFDHAGRPGEVGGSGEGGGSGKEMEYLKPDLAYVAELQGDLRGRARSLMGDSQEAAYHLGFRTQSEDDLALAKFVESATDRETMLGTMGSQYRWNIDHTGAAAEWAAAKALGGNGSGGSTKKEPTLSQKELDAYTARQEFTQDFVRANYGNEIEVYRGIKGLQAKKLREAIEGGASEADVSVRSLASYSVSFKDAQEFAGGKGAVFKVKVKASDVWSTNELGVRDVVRFKEDRKEFVMLNRAKTVRVKATDVSFKGMAVFAFGGILDDESNWHYFLTPRSTPPSSVLHKRFSVGRLAEILKGGPGSGNFDHAGRPGEVGGSATDSSTPAAFGNPVGNPEGTSVVNSARNKRPRVGPTKLSKFETNNLNRAMGKTIDQLKSELSVDYKNVGINNFIMGTTSLAAKEEFAADKRIHDVRAKTWAYLVKTGVLSYNAETNKLGGKEMYRGIAIPREAVQKWKVGGSLDLGPMASFSESDEVSLSFAKRNSSGHIGDPDMKYKPSKGLKEPYQKAKIPVLIRGVVPGKRIVGSYRTMSGSYISFQEEKENTLHQPRRVKILSMITRQNPKMKYLEVTIEFKG